MHNLNFMSPIGYTGYGISSFNMLKALKKEECNISLFSLSNLQTINPESKEDADIIKECIRTSIGYDYKAPCLKVWHSNDLSIRIGSGPYHVYTFFELDTMTDQEKHNLKSCENIFVASKWARRVLTDNGISSDITVCPLGVDTDIFKPFENDTNNNKYIFYNIGKWEKRKSHDVLIECFNKSFSEQDDVELWLFSHNPFLNTYETQEWVNLVKNSKLAKKIKIFPRFATQIELYNTVKMADCGIFCSRAEGWNNGVIESMSMGKPVIVTDYSAHQEYCNDKNSFLVNITETEPAIDNKWFNGQGNWAKITEDCKEQIIFYMKKCYNNQIYKNSSGLKTANNYKWENTARILYERLFDVYTK